MHHSCRGPICLPLDNWGAPCSPNVAIHSKVLSTATTTAHQHIQSLVTTHLQQDCFFDCACQPAGNCLGVTKSNHQATHTCSPVTLRLCQLVGLNTSMTQTDPNPYPSNAPAHSCRPARHSHTRPQCCCCFCAWTHHTCHTSLLTPHTCLCLMGGLDWCIVWRVSLRCLGPCCCLGALGALMVIPWLTLRQPQALGNGVPDAPHS